MNTIILLASLFWNDLEAGKNYLLTKPLNLNSSVILSSNQKINLNRINVLEEIQVINFEFKLFPCTAELSKKSAAMVIVDTVGVELTQGCVLDLYVENKDIFQASFLKADARH